MENQYRNVKTPWDEQTECKNSLAGFKMKRLIEGCGNISLAHSVCPIVDIPRVGNF
jgi:hypothetical protein